MFDANWSQVLETLRPPDPSTPVVPCDSGWDFLFEDIPYSTVVNEVRSPLSKLFIVETTLFSICINGISGSVLHALTLLC